MLLQAPPAVRPTIPRNDVEDPTQWTTRVMALVVYLRLRGFEYTKMKKEGDICYWYYDNTNALKEEAATYFNGEALVDPSEFNRTFFAIKTAWREFMYGPQPAR